MNKKIIILLSALCVAVLSVAIVVFAGGKEPAKEITGVTFTSASFDYDGTEKAITVVGDIPDGVSVAYTTNKATNAGAYSAKAVLSGKGYKELTLSATLTINKIDIEGVTVVAEQSIKHDGNYHLPEISGDVPSGIVPEYYVAGKKTEGVIAIGVYDFEIVLENNNYNKLTLTCEYTIKMNVASLANTLFESFGQLPDPWSFFPDSFSVENKEIDSVPNYSNFVNVSSIPTNGIGKQLSVVYNVLNKTEKALSYVRPVYLAMNTVKNMYTTYLDKYPDDYQQYSGTVSGFTFALALDKNTYTLSANVSSISIKIFSDVEEGIYGARVQLNATTALKYTVSENKLTIAIDVLDSVATQISFVRNENTGKVLGAMYEYLVISGKQITATSALIEIGNTYTTLIGTKGDFIPTAVSRNCEVYLNSTGCLVGTEVREELTISGFTETYNTLWYTLNDVVGINTIKKVDEANVMNPDTIYINNSTDTIHTKLFGGLNAKTASRRFDIEFKTMYFYEYDEAKEEYKEVSCEIPMMFVQEEKLDDFTSDFYAANKNALSGPISLNVSQKDKQAVNYGYYTLLNDYDLIKDAVTFEMITNYCKF